MSKEKIVFIDSDLKEIIPGFLENRKKDINQLDDLIQNEQWKQIESIAHKLAGNAGSYGFDELGEIGSQLESACQNRDVELIKQYCGAYNEFMNNLKVEYK